MTQPVITLSTLDAERLERAIDARRAFRREQDNLERLQEELDRARIVPADEVPESCVRMNSRVRVRDLFTREVLQFQIVYPRDADVNRGRISVLAPLGTALIGVQSGATVQWRVPGGVRRLRVESVEPPPVVETMRAVETLA